MPHRHPQRHTKASRIRHIKPTNYLSREVRAMSGHLLSPDSSEQSCATVSSTAIHSQTPSARASQGETRAGKRGGQMNQEATARTTLWIPQSQSHLTLSQAINSVETHRRHLITEHKVLLAVNEDTNYCHT